LEERDQDNSNKNAGCNIRKTVHLRGVLEFFSFGGRSHTQSKSKLMGHAELAAQDERLEVPFALSDHEVIFGRRVIP